MLWRTQAVVGCLALVKQDEPAHQADWRHCTDDETDYRLDHLAH